MKKLISLAFVAVLSVTALLAQPQQGQGQQRQRLTPEQQVAQLDKTLKLDEKQKKEITRLYSDFTKAQQSEPRPEGRPSEEQMRKMQARMQELEKKVMGILRPEQADKYKKMQEERRKQQGNRPQR